MDSQHNNQSTVCLCRSDLLFDDCCGRFLKHGKIAPTAELLMRSRYTAYALKREDYLLATWHSSTRPLTLDLKQQFHQWLGLIIKHHEQSSPDQAAVEFVARYKINGRAYRLHEISRFARENGMWFYVDGDILHHG